MTWNVTPPLVAVACVCGTLLLSFREAPLGGGVEVRAQDADASAAPLPPELDRVLRDYERAWRAKDENALAELFTEDGFILPNQNVHSRGRDAIRAAYTDNGGPLYLEHLAHAMDGDVGWIIGIYGHAEDGPREGKFILALQRGEDGRWLIAGDIDNTSRQGQGQ
jgi:ketosteroid isomerase-like protein